MDKIHKLGLCGHYTDLNMTLKLKLQTLTVAKINITY